MRDRWDEFPPYVPVSERKKRNRKLGKKLNHDGKPTCPVVVPGKGRKMALSFWGDRWCSHLESFSDYENRLPRGRSYLRHGAVLDLQIQEGLVTALVSGSDLYNVEIKIKPLARKPWREIRAACSGQIGSLLELLEGRLSDQVMSVVTDQTRGLLPLPGEIDFHCDCPDWAVMCKHVAAVLFGIGVRLDDRPELLFTLRGVDPDELISGDLAFPGTSGNRPDDAADRLADGDLADIFGIDLEIAPEVESRPIPKPESKSRRFIATGSAIASLRENFGLSVEDFADVMEISMATVYRWENSTGKLNLHAAPRRKLEHLADIRDEIREGRFEGVPGS